jgi:hypothetical protein
LARALAQDPPTLIRSSSLALRVQKCKVLTLDLVSACRVSVLTMYMWTLPLICARPVCSLADRSPRMHRRPGEECCAAARRNTRADISSLRRPTYLGWSSPLSPYAILVVASRCSHSPRQTSPLLARHLFSFLNILGAGARGIEVFVEAARRRDIGLRLPRRARLSNRHYSAHQVAVSLISSVA